MEKAVEKRMMAELVEEISSKAADCGDLNIILRDIISRGQDARYMVEQRLRYQRMEEEKVLRLVVADAEKEDRLEAIIIIKANLFISIQVTVGRGTTMRSINPS